MKVIPRQLWLLRHARAESYQTSDYERPLAQQGMQQMSKICELVRTSSLPDLMISSPALRAKQTTELFCEQLNLNPDQVVWNEHVYNAAISTLINVVEQTSEADIILLTGHNPGLEGLLEYLTVGLMGSTSGSINSPSISIPTATLLQINMPGEWKTLDPGCATLHDILYSH